MHVDSSTIKRGDKVYTRHLLRNSFRENGKVKHQTIANLSSCSDDEIAALKLALKHKKNLSSLASLEDIEITLGKSVGAVWALNVVAQRLGIAQALGNEHGGKLALLQVIARTVDQGSRLSAVRFARRHAVCELLGISKLDEDDLYENLAWLATEQERVERKLFAIRFKSSTPTLFLYDVTSSYLEGVCNELADWGYNRDKKRGKMQVVVGLLVGPDGLPVAIRVFKGNTNDPKTVSEQVRILAETFGIKEVTLVGDRGMLKGPQIESLPDDFRYITAITKPQIQKMLSDGVLQYELFSERVCEVDSEGIRYVLRRNPLRVEQVAQTRQSKLDSVEKTTAELTRYLAEHPQADADKALAKVSAKVKRLKADKWLAVSEKERVLGVEKDEDALSRVALLDGCYVVKSDVSKDSADAQTLHDRYCDLEMVERVFRSMKTVHLEMRPVYVKKKASVEGHAFVVMLSLLLQRELERCWANLDITVKEGIDELAGIHIQEVQLGNAKVHDIPKPNQLGNELLDNASIQLPPVLPTRTARVHTKKMLQSERN